VACSREHAAVSHARVAWMPLMSEHMHVLMLLSLASHPQGAVYVSQGAMHQMQLPMDAAADLVFRLL